MEFIESMNLGGLALGIATFLTIGIFHPIVIKCEYHFGVGCWWWFLLLGLLFCALSVFTANWLISTILGVVAFSSFWSILEIFQQRKRVQKGWFPKNPKRKY
ncbi:MAG: DUF4491 family protein [Bacteroidales bacterium]|jgi:uncharacterized membrane protein YdbT with pleckstrin-like domain|nr:DUF4491 family protein [Bacteroidales bacterium]MBP5419940.1 DUF4491 family protein [Bacteroidales bacterium]